MIMHMNGSKLQSSALFPCISAMVCVLLLIGSLSVICIGGLAFAGSLLAHGNNVEHAAGKIVEIGPGRDFVLQTATGQHLSFQCGSYCSASLGHLQRHLREHAMTDIYYLERDGKGLMAVDVD